VKVAFINEGFTAGEISSDLHGRVSSDLYKESVASLENMVSTIQGALIRRPGSRFVALASEQNSATGHRLIPYKINAQKGIILHVGPDNVTGYDQDGPVLASGVGVGAIVNLNPYFASHLDDWSLRSWGTSYSPGRFYGLAGADISWDAYRPSAFLRSGTRPPGTPTLWGYWATTHAEMVQAVELEPLTQYELSFVSTSPSVKVVPGVPQPLPGHVRVIEVVDPADFFPLEVVPDDYVTNVIADLPYTIDAQAGTVSFVTPAWGVNKTIHIEVRVSHQGTASGSWPYDVYPFDTNLTTCKLTKQGLPAGIVTFPSPWAGYDISQLSFAPTPEFPSKLILAHPDVAPHELIYNPTTDVWTFAPITFVSAPWAVGDYPGTVGIHLGRLILASSRLQPERIWLSKVLDYFNFTIGTGASDAFFGDLSEPGRILWLRSMWSLVIGAESGLWDISPFVGSVLAPGNAKTFKHQAHHSSNSAPAFTNNEVAYIAEGNRRMYSVRREGDENAYVDKELSFTARHLTVSGFRDIAWAEFPYNTIWSSIPDVGFGTLMGGTYDPKLLANAGWHRHDLGGPVMAAGVVSIGGIDQVFLLINRVTTVGGALAIERFDWTNYLDSAVSRAYAAPTTTIDGLEHLEGHEVYALTASGTVYGPHTVASGEIELEDAITSCVVGLSFNSKVITKRPEGLSRAGTSQGLKKRWNKIFVRVSPGSRPIINGYRPPERDPATPLNEGQPAAFEDVEVSNLGWSKEGYITVEEHLPIQLVIAAIFGHITAETL
jgi:hypothetical protein